MRYQLVIIRKDGNALVLDFPDHPTMTNAYFALRYSTNVQQLDMVRTDKAGPVTVGSHIASDTATRTTIMPRKG